MSSRGALLRVLCTDKGPLNQGCDDSLAKSLPCILSADIFVIYSFLQLLEQAVSSLRVKTKPWRGHLYL